jgi:hypothetical protein
VLTPNSGGHDIPSAILSPNHRQGHDLRSGLTVVLVKAECSPASGYRTGILSESLCQLSVALIRSSGELITVSIRNARPSFRYCLTRECLKNALIVTSVSRVTTFVLNS